MFRLGWQSVPRLRRSGLARIRFGFVLAAADMLGRICHRGRIARRKTVVQRVVELGLLLLGLILLGRIFVRHGTSPIPANGNGRSERKFPAGKFVMTCEMHFTL